MYLVASALVRFHLRRHVASGQRLLSFPKVLHRIATRCDMSRHIYPVHRLANVDANIVEVVHVGSDVYVE